MVIAGSKSHVTFDWREESCIFGDMEEIKRTFLRDFHAGEKDRWLFMRVRVKHATAHVDVCARISDLLIREMRRNALGPQDLQAQLRDCGVGAKCDLGL